MSNKSAYSSRKKPKTLSGIETGLHKSLDNSSTAGKNLKPYQGLKLFILYLKIDLLSRKKPKTLSGIETLKVPALAPCRPCRKKPKTLSGIETFNAKAIIASTAEPEKT